MNSLKLLHIQHIWQWSNVTNGKYLIMVVTDNSFQNCYHIDYLATIIMCSHWQMLAVTKWEEGLLSFLSGWGRTKVQKRVPSWNMEMNYVLHYARSLCMTYQVWHTTMSGHSLNSFHPIVIPIWLKKWF